MPTLLKSPLRARQLMGRHWAPSPDPLNSQNYLPLCAGYEEKNAELVRKVDCKEAEEAWQIHELQETQRNKDRLLQKHFHYPTSQATILPKSQ